MLPVLEVRIYRRCLNLIRQPLDSHLALWGLRWSMLPRLLPLLGLPRRSVSHASSLCDAYYLTRTRSFGAIAAEPRLARWGLWRLHGNERRPVGCKSLFWRLDSHDAGG